MTPELKLSGQPLSGQAEKGCGTSKSWESGRRMRVSASRKMTFEYWVRRKRCSFVKAECKSARPASDDSNQLIVDVNETRRAHREDPTPSSFDSMSKSPRRPRRRRKPSAAP